MQGVQLSLDLFNETKKSIVVTVERPDGSVFEQPIYLKSGEDPEEVVKGYQKTLGEPYGYYRSNGKTIRYIKKDAYLVISWRYE